MGKNNTNGKNSGKYSKKSGLSKKYAKNSSKKKSASGSQKRLKIPITPPLPLRKKMKKIQRKNMALLYSLENIILQSSFDDSSLIDANVLRILAKLLWEFENWAPKNNRKTPNTTQKKPRIELKTHELTLYLSMKTFITSSSENKLNSFIKKNFKKPDIWNSLACIFDSANFWHTNGGRRGYLTYISEQIPNLPDFFKDSMVESLLDNDIIEEIDKADPFYKRHFEKVKKYQKSHYTKKEIKGYAAISDAIFTNMKIEAVLKGNSEEISEGNTLNEKATILIDAYVKEIIKSLKNANKILPEISEIYESLIYAEIFLKNYDIAEEFFIEASNKFSKEIDIAITGGLFYFNSGNYQKSIEIFTEIFNRYNDVYGLYMTGCCYYNMKEFDQAIKYFKKIESIDENYENLYHLLEQCFNMKNPNNLEEFEKYGSDDFDFLIELIKSLHNINTILFMGNEIIQHELSNIKF